MACTRFVTRAVVGTLASCCLIAAPSTAAAADPSACGWLEPACAGELPEEPTNVGCVLGFYPFYPPAAELPSAPYITEPPPGWPLEG